MEVMKMHVNWKIEGQNGFEMKNGGIDYRVIWFNLKPVQLKQSMWWKQPYIIILSFNIFSTFCYFCPKCQLESVNQVNSELWMVDSNTAQLIIRAALFLIKCQSSKFWNQLTVYHPTCISHALHHFHFLSIIFFPSLRPLSFHDKWNFCVVFCLHFSFYIHFIPLYFFLSHLHFHHVHSCF